MSDELRYDVGRHDEAIETLKAEVKAMREDLSEIKTILATARGGWKTLLAVGSAAGVIGAAITKLVAMVKGAPS